MDNSEGNMHVDTGAYRKPKTNFKVLLLCCFGNSVSIVPLFHSFVTDLQVLFTLLTTTACVILSLMLLWYLQNTRRPFDHVIFCIRRWSTCTFKCSFTGKECLHDIKSAASCTRK